MSDHIHQAIATLERELEAIDQKRGDLDAAIGALRKLAIEGVTSSGRVSKRTHIMHIMRAKVHQARTAFKTNERARSAPTRSTEPPLAARRRSLHDDALDAQILKALRQGPLKPNALATAAGMSGLIMRARVKELEKQGLVTVTGKTSTRTITLSRARAAKEVP